VIAIDTNVLVSAHREESPRHDAARSAVAALAEGRGSWAIPRPAGRITGGRVHDARVAALCHQHGVRELWTAERDFSRFPDVSVRNPLIDPKR
jgi:predicted nucleic acid-binding protein